MIIKNQSLKDYNTFGFEQSAEYFAVVSTEKQLYDLVADARKKNWPILVIGGGSNLVLTKDVPGLVIHLDNQTIKFSDSADENHQTVTVGAGVLWHDLVLKTLAENVRGLENLSLIPGSVGAAPIQNIGAYGVEVKDRIKKVRALHVPTMQWQTLQAYECDFSYRNSLFKARPNQFIITEVVFSLGNQHAITKNYKALSDYLNLHSLRNPTARQISKAIIHIRQSKLPDPKIIGNAGSFFQNPVVSRNRAEELKSHYPTLVSFPAGVEQEKLSAAWLIDSLGYKGARLGGVGVYAKQALVLTNDGTGTGIALLRLADDIRAAVKKKFDIKLSIEPVVI